MPREAVDQENISVHGLPKKLIVCTIWTNKAIRLIRQHFEHTGLFRRFKDQKKGLAEDIRS